MDYEACGVSEVSDRSVWGVSVGRRIQGVSMDRMVRVHARIQKDLPARGGPNFIRFFLLFFFLS